uniref:T-cell surface glycoprotein CD3 epsilon chain-like n=1 Tax=Doryrhamphus excisus TaxID=161450 RepID=UPI0025AE1CE6|nr:T-cell surface glycoprotein CD3 epsilon chain-like [Doryrhamphus excisus]
MKYNTVVSSLTGLWMLIEIVWCKDSKTDITVEPGTGQITIVCTGNNTIVSTNGDYVKFPLKFKDENSGEYKCVPKNLTPEKARHATGTTIFVKFRSCDNCVELDVLSIAGLVAGEVMATTVLGVAVYLVASQAHAGFTSPQHKSSDRKHLISKEPNRRVPNDDYQELLRHKGGRKEIYDTLSDKR